MKQKTIQQQILLTGWVVAKTGAADDTGGAGVAGVPVGAREVDKCQIKYNMKVINWAQLFKTSLA